LYQVNTRVWLTDLSRSLGRKPRWMTFPTQSSTASPDGVRLGLAPERLADGACRAARLTHKSRVAPRIQETLPDLREDDIGGSGFAITGYTVHQTLGGDEALARIRERLRRRGLRLMLDFVPNHTAPDHPWVIDHPDYFVAGTESDLAREPHNYTRVAATSGNRVLALGRDPYFAGLARHPPA
jgi:hypothetical protein